MTHLDAQITNDILATYEITPDADGSLSHEPKRDYLVTATRMKLRDINDPDADQVALDAGLIDEMPDSADDIPADVCVWRLDDPQVGRYEADTDEARAWFAETVDWYYHNLAETLDEVLGDDSSHPHAWMTDNVSDEDRAVTPDAFADVLVHHLLAGNDMMSESIAQHVVSEFRRISPFVFAEMWREYRPDMDSEAGSVNTYMPDGYRAMAEWLAAERGIFDNRGNASVSALLRKLLDEEISHSQDR